MRVLLGKAVSAWSRLHPTVAATLGGLAAAALLAASGRASWASSLDFSAILLRGLLPFLLFAGALHVNLPSLKAEASFVALLASAGVVAAAFLVGASLRAALILLGRDVPPTTCFLFGALIAPTDPVAVLAIFRRTQVPRPLAVAVGAESLFNDGFAVVVFASILGAARGEGVSLGAASLLFLKQTGGGLLLGLLLGELCVRAAEGPAPLSFRLAATAALAWGGCAGANALGLSGLLAVVVAGIRVGGRDLRLKNAWTLADGALNAAAFALLGLAALRVPWSRDGALAGLVAIPLVLAARALVVGAAMGALRPWRGFLPGTFRALTWGGLRGALPVALALTLADAPGGAMVLVAAYVVGLFSLVVQGSTLQA